MNYILTMTLSGSVLSLLYLLLKLLYKERLSATWSYRLIKAVILYFLIPLPWLKKAYSMLAEKVIAVLRLQKEEVIVRTFRDENLIFFSGEGYYLNHPLQIQLILAGIWALAAAVTIAAICWRHFYGIIILKQCRGAKETAEDRNLIMQLKQKYDLKCEIQCFCHLGEELKKELAFTTGIFRPVIIYSHVNKREKNLVLAHEVVHIKRMDVIWKMLVYCVLVIHWYNPAAWWLVKELEVTSENSCDEVTMKGRSHGQKQRYMKLLINMSARTKEENCVNVTLSKEGKILEERIKNMIQKKNNWGKVVSACVVGGAVLLNSLTVFAYEDVQYYHEEVQTEQEIEDVLHTDHIFVGGTFEEAKDVGFSDIAVEVLYDSQFMDAEGNIYPAQEQINTYATCSHSFVSGTLQDHAKNSSGGCTVTYYEAQRCSKCALVVRGEEINTITYKVCPH